MERIMAATRSTPPHHVVSRVTEDLRARIESGALPSGTRLPSVRQLARERGVSPFSAAEIYNVLVAACAIEARAGLGYFVSSRRKSRTLPALTPEFPADSVWERRREALGRPIKVDAGCGWLPRTWLHGEGVRAALRAVARQAQLPMEGYGNPLGLHDLRAHLSTLLKSRGIDAREDQFVLTHGASQGIDLIMRECLSPGDTAIVEDPGYPPIFALLKDRGVRVLAVARTESGPDVDALAKLLKRRRVRCFFTNTTCHNPTGTTTHSSTAHRILELAARHDLTIIEDDIFADLGPRDGGTLASLDELQRVVYLSSFSKTVSPSLRAGFVVATPALAQKLARVKVTSSLGSSELLERLLLQILTHGHYRRHLNRLRDRLAAAHLNMAREFEGRGGEIAFQPQSGLFLWAKLPSKESVGKLWRLALSEGVLLAPGELFRPDGSATAYWRFNVAQCESPQVFHFLDAL
jgi:DNA-binding transcriptional MocR family regulator